jgi:ubiquinone/menaquinone biosynthesis C-methylase UbiE
MALITDLPIEEVYNRIANQFDYTRHRIWGSVKKFMNNLQPNSRVLEVGCGSGRFTQYLSKYSKMYDNLTVGLNNTDFCLSASNNVAKLTLTVLS